MGVLLGAAAPVEPRFARALTRTLAVPFGLAGTVGFVLAVTDGRHQLVFAVFTALAFALAVAAFVARPEDFRIAQAVTAAGTVGLAAAIHFDGVMTTPLIALVAWAAPLAFAAGSARAIVGHIALAAAAATFVLLLDHKAPSHDGTAAEVVRWMCWSFSVPALGLLTLQLAVAMRRQDAQRQEAADIARLARFQWDPVADSVEWGDGPAAAWWPRSLTQTLQVAHPDDRIALRTAMEEAARGTAFELEVRRMTGGGGIRFIHTRGELRNGKVVGTTQDITSLRAAQAAARDAESRFREVLERSPDAFLATDSRARIVLVNRAAEELFGRTRDELIGTYAYDLCAPTSAQDVADLWTEVWAGREDPAIPRRFKILGAGGESTVSVTGSLMDLDGERSLFVALRDVTEVLRAERTAGELERRLADAERMESVGRLAGGMAHDFNNLLTVIVSGSDHVASGLRPDDPLAGEVAEIRAAAQSAADLTRQLLVFSRRDTPRREVVDLSALVRRTADLLRRTLGEDVEVVVRADAPGCTITADPSQIEQVVVNLSLNARDAMPEGGRLELGVERRMGHGRNGRPVERVALTVRDSGHGMPGEVLAHAFEPFFTTKHLHRGTGLGLATVQSVVERLGGTVSLSSDAGVGTMATVEIPRTTAPSGAGTSTPVPLAVEAGPSGDGECVLVIEDQPAVRRSLVRILKRGGYDVLEAGDGEQALNLAERHGPAIQLVVSDVLMPGMSGPAAVARLREVHGPLPVLYTSGYLPEALTGSGELESDVAVVEGELLQKPFTPETVLIAVRRALAGS